MNPLPIPNPPTFGPRAKRLVKLIASWLVAILLAFLVQQFALQSYRVFGQSMDPTLRQGDFLIISKIGPVVADIRRTEFRPARGDIVVLKNPYSQTRLIKRVIGLPGERIAIMDGRVTIFNPEHTEGFDHYQELNLPNVYTAGSLSTQIPEGHVFLIGDNRGPGGSSDSRNELGPVDTDAVIGKTIVRLWPLGQFHTY